MSGEDYTDIRIIFKSPMLVIFNLSAANHWRAAAKFSKNPQILVYIYIFLVHKSRYCDYHYDHAGGLQSWLTLKRNTLLSQIFK